MRIVSRELSIFWLPDGCSSLCVDYVRAASIDSRRHRDRLHRSCSASWDVRTYFGRTGIGLLAGTDLPADARNGTIQDELAYLVEAGLTPMQALETATCNAANFLGKSDDFGTIQRCKAADLVLLDADPLENIRNTERIAVVFSRGRRASLPLRLH